MSLASSPPAHADGREDRAGGFRWKLKGVALTGKVSNMLSQRQQAIAKSKLFRKGTKTAWQANGSWIFTTHETINAAKRYTRKHGQCVALVGKERLPVNKEEQS